LDAYWLTTLASGKSTLHNTAIIDERSNSRKLLDTLQTTPHFETNVEKTWLKITANRDTKKFTD